MIGKGLKNIRGITKRWILNSFSLTLIILLLLVLSFAFVVRGYYYSGIHQTISGRSNELVNILNGEKFNSNVKFENKTREYVENFPDKERMELMIFNSNDEIIINSTGFEPEQNQSMPDYNAAKKSQNDYGSWTGYNSSGEKIMAVTRVIYSESGEYLGAVRYVVSLTLATRSIVISVIILSIIGIIFMSIVIVSNSYFIKSIVDPMYEMGLTANKIAQGDFDVRIHKKYDDEIGELGDIINYMASELKTSEKMKNDFISSVSHELRTPLTAIKGWAETMQMGEQLDRNTMEKGLKIIVSESERLSGIVEELLDFSRMQSGRMVMMMDKIDILAEIDEAVYIFKDKARSEKKELIYEAPATIPPVLGDKNRLKQVFINIIDNAIKYTDTDGSVLVKVVQDDGFIRVMITDDGCGIEAEHLPRVKEKFYKANQTRRGSGIGLAVANEIMTLHRGYLDISSQEGIGTVVTISVPIMNSDKPNL